MDMRNQAGPMVAQMSGGHGHGQEVMEALRNMCHEQLSQSPMSMMMGCGGNGQQSQGFGGAGQMNQKKLEELKQSLLQKFSDLIDELAKGFGRG